MVPVSENAVKPWKRPGISVLFAKTSCYSQLQLSLAAKPSRFGGSVWGFGLGFKRSPHSAQERDAFCVTHFACQPTRSEAR